MLYLHKYGLRFTIAKCRSKVTEKTKERKYKRYVALPPVKYKKELLIWYRNETGKSLDLLHPKTFNEKMQWLKLYDTTPLKTMLADKRQVREWVSEKIGDKYLVPILGTWNKFDEIDFQRLPEQFVLKCNHGCGWNLIVSNKSAIDYPAAKRILIVGFQQTLLSNMGSNYSNRDIRPCIIAEEYIKNGDGDLHDYKFLVLRRRGALYHVISPNGIIPI